MANFFSAAHVKRNFLKPNNMGWFTPECTSESVYNEIVYIPVQCDVTEFTHSLENYGDFLCAGVREICRAFCLPGLGCLTDVLPQPSADLYLECHGPSNIGIVTDCYTNFVIWRFAFVTLAVLLLRYFRVPIRWPPPLMLVLDLWQEPARNFAGGYIHILVAFVCTSWYLRITVVATVVAWYISAAQNQIFDDTTEEKEKFREALRSPTEEQLAALSDESTCYICLESMTSEDCTKMPNCEHFFHRSCSLRWSEYGSGCPYRCDVPADL